MPRRRKAAKKSRLPPEPMPVGTEVVDFFQKPWIFGQYIASGGCGTVSFVTDIKKSKDFKHVVKVEPVESGSLFWEVHCYRRIAVVSKLSDWMNEKKCHVGISAFCRFGFFEHGQSRYRFLVLDRFGDDLQKKLEESGGIFPLKTVCLVGISVINTLEYIHHHGYVHGDIKASNLLLGHKKGTENQIYVVDMGVSLKYFLGDEHAENKPDARMANAGTPIFMSRDAHRGCHSRRSDLEVLVYNLLQWLTESLPWQHLTNCKELQKEKERHMNNCDEFLDSLFHGKQCPDGLLKLFHYVKDLQFEAKPDYDRCRKFLNDDLRSAGYDSNDVNLEFTKTKKILKKTPIVPSVTPKEALSNKKKANKRIKLR